MIANDKDFIECVRCGKTFDDYIPCRNVRFYGGFPKYACPHCGKLYVFSRRIIIDVEPCDYIGDNTQDDWGQDVVSDEEYYKTHKCE